MPEERKQVDILQTTKDFCKEKIDLCTNLEELIQSSLVLSHVIEGAIHLENLQRIAKEALEALNP